MKNIRLLCGVVGLAVLLVSCGEKKKNPTGPSGGMPDGGSSSSVTATISGHFSLNFSSPTGVGHIENTPDSKEMTIVAQMTVGTKRYALFIGVPSAPATGTYSLGDVLEAGGQQGVAVLTVIVGESAESVYGSVSGSINFDQVGTRLKGSFQFTAEDNFTSSQIQVTNGTFNVPVI